MRSVIKSLLLLLTGSFIHSGVAAQGTWTPLASPAPDYNQGVMVLLTDGSVLVKTTANSISSIGSGWNRLIPDETGSYINGTWVIAGSMVDSRLYFATQVLKDGSVYAAGGEYGSGRTKGERYFPQYDQWITLPAVPFATDTLSDANSEILPDGRVLQAVVISNHAVSHRTYIFDPTNDPGASTYTTGPTTRGVDNESSWLKLPDNTILFPDLYATTSERYNPVTNTWIADANLPVSLYDPFGSEMGAAFLLPDGRGFFLGSTSNTAYYTPSGTTAPGIWTAGPVMPDSLGSPDAAAAMMVNGKILCAVSHTPTQDTTFYRKMLFFEFDYQTNTFTKIISPEGGDSIGVASYQSNMLCLPDGSVLYARQGDDQYYVYKPSGSPLAAGMPSIDSIIVGTCDTFMATGKLFNGISEGAGYGDDWQMATNYPLVRISQNGHVYYGTTFNWNSTGVARGANEDSVQFTLPANVPHAGTYQLEIIANGIASTAVPFSFCDAHLGVATVAKTAARLSVYPNPATDQVSVKYLALRKGNYTIRLSDQYGRIVLEQQHSAAAGENTVALPLSGIAKGIYSISVADGTERFNAKVVVK